MKTSDVIVGVVLGMMAGLCIGFYSYGIVISPTSSSSSLTTTITPTPTPTRKPSIRYVNKTATTQQPSFSASANKKDKSDPEAEGLVCSRCGTYHTDYCEGTNRFPREYVSVEEFNNMMEAYLTVGTPVYSDDGTSTILYHIVDNVSSTEHRYPDGRVEVYRKTPEEANQFRRDQREQRNIDKAQRRQQAEERRQGVGRDRETRENPNR